MTTFEKLIAHFERFPGIGSRQAKRFVHHILSEDREQLKEFIELMSAIQREMSVCTSCFRYFTRVGDSRLCRVCADTHRDRSKLMVLERDSDLDAVERTGVYDGLYFVLGGTIPLLGGDDSKRLRGGALKELVSTRAHEGLTEIILGFSINPDGENTARYVESLLKETIETHHIRCSHLGRGLSTGSEIEYADPETIKNALKNRS